jgi:hypothetical protein
VSLFDCLGTAMAAGLANAPRARAAQSEFLELVKRLEGAYPTPTAQAIAAQMLRDAAKRSAASRRHTVLAQLMTARRNEALIGRASDPGSAVVQLIESREGGDTFESVRFVRDAYRRQFVGAIREILQTHSLDILGRVRNRVQLRDLVRELHGEATGNAAAHRMAGAWRKVSERARVLFNAHGGDVGERLPLAAAGGRLALSVAGCDLTEGPRRRAGRRADRQPRGSGRRCQRGRQARGARHRHRPVRG